MCPFLAYILMMLSSSQRISINGGLSPYFKFHSFCVYLPHFYLSPFLSFLLLLYSFLRSASVHSFPHIIVFLIIHGHFININALFRFELFVFFLICHRHHYLNLVIILLKFVYLMKGRREAVSAFLFPPAAFVFVTAIYTFYHDP